MECGNLLGGVQTWRDSKTVHVRFTSSMGLKLHNRKQYNGKQCQLQTLKTLRRSRVTNFIPNASLVPRPRLN